MGLIAFPLLVAIIGALMYALCMNPKLAEMGRILFFVGALACVLEVAPAMVRLFGR